MNIYTVERHIAQNMQTKVAVIIADNEDDALNYFPDPYATRNIRKDEVEIIKIGVATTTVKGCVCSDETKY